VTTNQVEDYLASGEELMLSFEAESVIRGDENNNESPNVSKMFGSSSTTAEYTFGASDRRIVYLDDSGAFKDIDYQHISSIESETEENNSGKDIGATLGCCGGFLFLGGLGSIADDPGTAILLLLIGIGLLVVAVKVFQNAEVTEKQKIKFITGDEAHQQIEVTLTSDTEANIAAELSSILRKQR